MSSFPEQVLIGLQNIRIYSAIRLSLLVGKKFSSDLVVVKTFFQPGGKVFTRHHYWTKVTTTLKACILLWISAAERPPSPPFQFVLHLQVSTIEQNTQKCVAHPKVCLCQSQHPSKHQDVLPTPSTHRHGCLLQTACSSYTHTQLLHTDVESWDATPWSLNSPAHEMSQVPPTNRGKEQGGTGWEWGGNLRDTSFWGDVALLCLSSSGCWGSLHYTAQPEDDEASGK